MLLLEATSCLFLKVTNSSFAGWPPGCGGRGSPLCIKGLFISLRFIPWFIDRGLPSPTGWAHRSPVCLSYVPGWRVYDIFDLHLPGVPLENITALGLHRFYNIFVVITKLPHFLPGVCHEKGFFSPRWWDKDFLAFRKSR